MFTDRLWILKAAAALGLLALLFNHSRQTLQGLHPDIERVALDWTAFRNHTFHLAAKEVLAVDATGFEIGTKVGSMKIRTRNPPPAGSHVILNVRPIGPRTLEVVELKILTGYDWKRPMNYVISIITVMVYLWLVRRRFKWNPEAGVFRSRY